MTISVLYYTIFLPKLKIMIFSAISLNI